MKVSGGFEEPALKRRRVDPNEEEKSSAPTVMIKQHLKRTKD
jgi:hypothetical protein